MVEIQFSGSNFTFEEDLKQFISEKIEKHHEFLNKATKIAVHVKRNMSDHNTTRNLRIEISVVMPDAYIQVEDRGHNEKEIIDLIDPILKRRLKRYHDQLNKWEKATPWKASLAESLEEHDEIEPDHYIDYSPSIETKQYADDSPLHPAQAIERMELLGKNAFLFKNIESNKYAMVHKLNNGRYGMIEPAD